MYGSHSEESACNAEDLGLIPGLGRSPGGGHDNPLQHSCLENPHGQRSLAGYSPQGHKESDTTEQLSALQHVLIKHTLILIILSFHLQLGTPQTFWKTLVNAISPKQCQYSLMVKVTCSPTSPLSPFQLEVFCYVQFISFKPKNQEVPCRWRGSQGTLTGNVHNLCLFRSWSKHPAPEAIPDSAKLAKVSFFYLPTVSSDRLSHSGVSVAWMISPPDSWGWGRYCTHPLLPQHRTYW